MNKFLYKGLHDTIMNNIKNGNYKPNELLPSEKELCKQFEVSMVTVRRALEELEKQDYIKKFKGKGSVVNKAIRSGKTSNPKNIALIDIPFVDHIKQKYEQKYEYQNNWKNEIYKSLFNELKNEYNLITEIIHLDNFEEDFRKSIVFDIDKIVILGECNKDVIQYLRSLNKYVVVYNLFDTTLNVCSVSNNDRESYKKVVKNLIKMGHQKIAAINGIIRFSESTERFMGYQEGLIEENIYVNPHYTKWSDMTPESGYYLMKELLELKDRPTAVVCVNDGVALGVYDAVREAGLKIPDDVSVFAHDNTSLCEELNPTLCSIDPQYNLIGIGIANRLKEKIWLDNLIIVESKLVFRNSIKPMKTTQ